MIKKLTEKKNVTSSQLTLAWLLAQSGDIFPIPGIMNVDRLKENLGSLEIKLMPEEENQMRVACMKVEVADRRYLEDHSATLFMDTPAL